MNPTKYCSNEQLRAEGILSSVAPNHDEINTIYNKATDIQSLSVFVADEAVWSVRDKLALVANPFNALVVYCNVRDDSIVELLLMDRMYSFVRAYVAVNHERWEEWNLRPGAVVIVKEHRVFETHHRGTMFPLRARIMITSMLLRNQCCEKDEADHAMCVHQHLVETVLKMGHLQTIPHVTFHQGLALRQGDGRVYAAVFVAASGQIQTRQPRILRKMPSLSNCCHCLKEKGHLQCAASTCPPEYITALVGEAPLDLAQLQEWYENYVFSVEDEPSPENGGSFPSCVNLAIIKHIVRRERLSSMATSVTSERPTETLMAELTLAPTVLLQGPILEGNVVAVDAETANNNRNNPSTHRRTRNRKRGKGKGKGRKSSIRNITNGTRPALTSDNRPPPQNEQSRLVRELSVDRSSEEPVEVFEDGNTNASPTTSPSSEEPTEISEGGNTNASLTTSQSSEEPTETSEAEPRDWLVLAKGSKLDPSLVKNTDACPVCFDSFKTTLSGTYAATVCDKGHALCLPCISALGKNAEKGRIMRCPCCRSKTQEGLINELPRHVIEQDEGLASLLAELPLEHERRVDLGTRLLQQHDFCLSSVIGIVERMLWDQTNVALFQREGSLSSVEKQEIFVTAQSPVETLLVKLDTLIYKRRVEGRATSANRSEIDRWDTEIRETQKHLVLARKTARDIIYRKLNEVGDMGVEGEDGLTRVDFHCLRVKDMQATFSEKIVPILCACKKVRIITGRGLHSASGESILMKKLKDRIMQEESNMRFLDVDGNPGALDVLWV